MTSRMSVLSEGRGLRDGASCSRSQTHRGYAPECLDALLADAAAGAAGWHISHSQLWTKILSFELEDDRTLGPSSRLA
jgi:hypothetical protein